MDDWWEDFLTMASNGKGNREKDDGVRISGSKSKSCVYLFASVDTSTHHSFESNSNPNVL